VLPFLLLLLLGQYGMVLLSRFPIDTSSIRTFQFFLWGDMPGAGEAQPCCCFHPCCQQSAAAPCPCIKLLALPAVLVWMLILDTE
jgi:hypothetical protein